MKRVTGLGGLFFKSPDTKRLKEWYRTHLGFNVTDWGATFVWKDVDESKKTWSRTEWSPFKEDTTYFEPGDQPYMFNYRVHDLEKLLQVLKEEGVEIKGEMDTQPYGKFGWIIDPEKRKIELWEPVDDQFGDAPLGWTERVTGVGGVFFKSEDPKTIKEWYSKHLGIGESTFQWHDLNFPDAKAPAQTVWAPFKKDTDYFSPGDKPFMFNYRVKDLATLLQTLKKEGVQIAGEMQEYPYGKFGWIIDCDGSKVELWEPIDD